MTTKTEIRQAFRQRLGALASAGDEAPSELASELAVAIGTRLEKLFLSERWSPGIWAAFQPVDHEPDIRPTLMSLEFERGIEWAYPRATPTELEFYLPDDPAVFTENQWGILEPDPATSRRLDATEIRGFLIPALAFDTNCNRLGRGAGFYDRSLARIHEKNASTIKIGIGFDAQISDTDLPTEEFDIPMDWVVTESRVIPHTARRKTP